MTQKFKKNVSLQQKKAENVYLSSTKNNFKESSDFSDATMTQRSQQTLEPVSPTAIYYNETSKSYYSLGRP